MRIIMGLPIDKSSSVSVIEVKRMLYVDNIRIFLTVLVVLHHQAIGYGGVGDWVIFDKATDSISPIFLALFNGINGSFLMAFFFLISGYFVPRSFDKKGPKNFVKDRLIRLWIPVLVFAALIWQMTEYVLLNFTKGRDVPFYKIMASHFSRIDFEVGPLWFVEALLFFTLVYAVYRLVADRFLPGFQFKPFNNGFPTKKAVFLSIAIISIGTFIVRIKIPIGVWIYHFQVGDFVHYIFCFWLGILAYRGKWLESLTESQGKFWGKVALATLVVLPVVFFTVQAWGGGVGALMGRFTLFSAIFSIWQSFVCLSIIIALLYLFQKRFDNQGCLLKGMSPNAYTVYIIHQLVVVILMTLFLSIALPSIVKFFIVAPVSITLCFLISHFIVRKIPYSKRVLG